MRCAWQAFLNLLPVWMRREVDKLGADTLQELRLRIGLPPELVAGKDMIRLNSTVNAEDLQFCINAASQYSPWAAKTVARGFLTAAGGHRIGICGDAVVQDGKMTGIRSATSICLRVARDFPGIARSAANIRGSILIIGAPGSGKTTLLRDLIRQKSNLNNSSISVVDERCEVFPLAAGKYCFPTGNRTDILSGSGKVQGIDAVLRSMSPGIIAVDEITASEDCEALLHAGWCGVELIATAHASSIKDLNNRTIYVPLVKSGIFDTVIILQPDKSWRAERMPS